MADLKPCPFCGSRNLTVKQNMQLDGMTFIVCEPCGMVASFHGNESKKDTVRRWNKRKKAVLQ